MSSPTFTIVAGPNGAGKSTFIQIFFSEALTNGTLVNADMIAQTINPLNNAAARIDAARLAIKKRNSLLIESKDNFIIETTLASRALLLFIKKARKAGFIIVLHFLWITMPTLCDFRVKDRVSKGGHDIDLSVILRRYFFGLKMLSQYIELVDEAHIYRADEMPNLIASKAGLGINIISPNDWFHLQNDIQLLTKNKIIVHSEQ